MCVQNSSDSSGPNVRLVPMGCTIRLEVPAGHLASEGKMRVWRPMKMRMGVDPDIEMDELTRQCDGSLLRMTRLLNEHGK